MNLKFAYQFDTSGHTSQTNDNDHIRDLIEQVLFTMPGERVNRPTFGTGLMQLVFQPNSDQLATTTQFTVQGALQQWLGDLIAVSDVQVTSVDSTIQVTISYTVRSTQQNFIAQYTS
jgi:phage baseplate assembly protein W